MTLRQFVVDILGKRESTAVHVAVLKATEEGFI